MCVGLVFECTYVTNSLIELYFFMTVVTIIGICMAVIFILNFTFTLLTL